MKQLVILSSVTVFAVVLLSCGGDPAIEGQSAGFPSAPHPVVIVAIDGLRADALSAYGASDPTPNFDALAAESVRFEWAWAQAPELMPSLGAVLSGMYPTANGLRGPGDHLQDEAVTLAEALGDAGMATAAFLEGAPGGGDFGLAQGFDTFEVVERPGAGGIKWMNDHLDENFLLLIAGWGSRAIAEVDLLLDEGEAIDPDRVAEVLASRDGDEPLQFTEAELARVRDWYAARIQIIDAFIGDFMAALETAKLDERATLVVLGSNGLALQEHDDLFGETVYAPTTRVPLFVRFPDAKTTATVSKTVELLDLMPTVVELVGAEAPEGVQGSSLLPVIDGTSTPPYVAFGESRSRGGQRFAALAGYRAVAAGAGDGLELYHTAADPLELANIAEAEPDKLAKLAGDLEAWHKMVTARSLDPELRADAEELDAETLKQLQSLGYVQ